MTGKWVNQTTELKTLEGTNYSMRKKIFNGKSVWMVYNFNAQIGMADKVSEAKQVVKYHMNGSC